MNTMVANRIAIGLTLSGLVSCTAPGGPGSEPAGPAVRTNDGGPGDVSVSSQALCLPANAEGLPGRVIEAGDIGGPPGKVERTIFVTDLFGRFKGICGACHVDNSIGGFKVDIVTFPKIDQAKVLAAIGSDDPTKFMPPPVSLGKPWSQRGPGDPVVALVAELQQWFAKGAPSDVFTVLVDAEEAGASYAVPQDMARRLTNMGSCIPERQMVAIQNAEMDQLDALFKDATELPDKLSETDLTSLDNAVLARRGVVAFAPGYPLWSEDSGKMRAIRVPRGTSVKFDKATQSFSIPNNTRFYKTFLKKIVDADGNVIWRKIETRLIVARADTDDPDALTPITALFGSYAWNEDETEAVLVRDTLRNGEPFGDRMFTYVADQPRYRAVVDAMPRNLDLELRQEKNSGVVRHYSIPGKQRCIECHMGSPGANFVLGFTPLQIRRRPKGEAGVYEEAGPDELNQLQRLIDYGVITGISSPSEIRGLEEAQGTRKPRNQYELTAQAYLVGNCSHCHNPRGFPSVKSPELVEALNFLPGEKGGIFQFPLERTSPLRRRGASQDVEIPYITPSLRDHPKDVSPANPEADKEAKKYPPGLWAPKWVDCLKGIWGLAFCDLFNQDNVRFVSAPWRSLLYRNVDTPYIYADDYTVFPHMPRHSAGFDCRAPRIMGDWMVSIPAVHKEEGALFENSVRGGCAQGVACLDTAAQPYEEVKPGDPRYGLAMEGVSERLYEYHHGKRYDYCPDRSDIVVPEALTTTDPKKLTPPDTLQYKDAAKKFVTMPKEGVPDRAHWVPSDLTETPGEWSPRRGDWQEVLVKPKPVPGAVVADVPSILQRVRITKEMRDYALTEIPFGVWKAKAGCDFAGVKTARAYTGSDRLKWMDNPRAKLDPEAPVYTITPGGAVFGNICINCHGPRADSKGLLAEAISEMTGGDARVANFKGGLLGPADKPVGTNFTRVFGPVAKDTGIPAEDWAARYLSWMALGGTQRVLPDSLLKIVGATLIMGEARKFPVEGTANMLALARGMCANVLAWEDDVDFNTVFNNGDLPLGWGDHTSLLDRIGDAEMWLHLCSVGNRPVVRVPKYDGQRWTLDLDSSFYWGEEYGNNPVMDHRGAIASGIKADNLFPTCLRAEDAGKLMTPAGQPIPTCPAGLFAERMDASGAPAPKFALAVVRDGSGNRQFLGQDEWAVQGGANAGIAVLLYLEEVLRGNITPKPGYDHCEKRK